MAIPLVRILENGLIVDNHPLRPPFFSIRNQWPHLRGRSLVIGIIGPRGSCKSTSGGRIISLDYLLTGKNAWSNMPIALDLATPSGSKATLQTKEPERKLSNCYDGVVFLDEVNEDRADSYRSMSAEALEFSYDTQELRKSKLDLIWTTQSETFCNPRLRFQTDIIIKCADLSLTKKVGIGEYSKWEIWDYSGIVTGKTSTTKLAVSPTIFIKPWWNVMDTTLKQRMKKENAEAENEVNLYPKAAEIASYVRDSEKVRILKIWSMFGIDMDDRNSQRQILKILGSEFDIFPDGRRDYLKVEKEFAEA